MIKNLKIETDGKIDFLILAINSHVKSYKVCWQINQKLNLKLIKNKDHILKNKKKFFERFSYFNKQKDIKYDVISNHSQSGYLDIKHKSVNYFMIVRGGVYNKEKIIKKLNTITDILLTFELNLNNINSIEPFILYD